jgi:hypothetical protein
MRSLTHQFAHSETLDRARRWLIHAGISADRIHVHHHGVPRLAVTAEPAEVQSIEMIIRIAEMNDPDGLPGFWDLARLEPTGPESGEEMATPPSAVGPTTFTLSWHPVDAAWDEELQSQSDLNRAYREMRS